MKTLTLQQGSDEWLAHRRTTRNASDASVMMGAFPTFPRRELVKIRATGLDREHSDYVQKHVLDRGHDVEPALRAFAEQMLGEDLYPVTGVSDDGYLGASFDGVTLGEDVILEAKQFSAEKAACIARGEIPPQDYWQVVQQFAVCESAERCLYMVGDGTPERTVSMMIPRARVAPDILTLLAGWHQFDDDVADYQPEAAAAPPAVGRTPDQLPALHIEVTGMVTASNLAVWKDAAIAVFQGIRTDLQTDQDFADAEQTVKWCGEIEDKLKAAKEHALSQTESIDAMFRTIDAIAAEARAKRLELDKLVKQRKESIRGEIVAAGVAAVRAHFDAINATLGQYRIDPPQSLTLDIGAAIKGKKSISSMRDAVDAAAASAKVAASQRAERIRANVAILEQHAEHRHLFADAVNLAHAKAPDDLTNLIASRIREHQEREAARLEQERERIRKEEADRLERERQREEAARIEHARKVADALAAAEQPKNTEAAKAVQPDTAPAAVVSTIAQTPAQEPAPVAAERPGALIKLGDINAALAPLSITADGLARLGFRPVESRGAAKLYHAAAFPGICTALAKIVADAPARLAVQSEAA